MPVPLDNPYWAAVGAVAFADPDGWRVVLAPAAAQITAQNSRPVPGDIGIELYTGPRDDLRKLFELAEDSPTELDSYLHAGRVLVARSGGGCSVTCSSSRPPGRGRWSSRTWRCLRRYRATASATRLVRAALELAAAGSAASMVVATAAADVGNLRFYQRQGFRFRSVDRDAFGPATGYPAGLEIDAIALRDRMWLDRAIGPAQLTGPGSIHDAGDAWRRHELALRSTGTTTPSVPVVCWCPWPPQHHSARTWSARVRTCRARRGAGCRATGRRAGGAAAGRGGYGQVRVGGLAGPAGADLGCTVARGACSAAGMTPLWPWQRALTEIAPRLRAEATGGSLGREVLAAAVVDAHRGGGATGSAPRGDRRTSHLV